MTFDLAKIKATLTAGRAGLTPLHPCLVFGWPACFQADLLKLSASFDSLHVQMTVNHVSFSRPHANDR